MVKVMMVFLVSCWLSRSSLVHVGAVKAYRLLLCVNLNSQWKPVWRSNIWTAFGCFQQLPLEMPAVGIDLAGKWGTLPWGVEHSLCKIPFYLAGLESYPALCNTGPSPEEDQEDAVHSFHFSVPGQFSLAWIKRKC